MRSESGRWVRWLAVSCCVAGLLVVLVGGLVATGVTGQDVVSEVEPLELKTPAESKPWSIKWAKKQKLALSAKERHALSMYPFLGGDDIAGYVRGLTGLPDQWKKPAAAGKHGFKHKFSSVEEFIKATDRAISKVRFDRPTVLWRGFGRPDLPRDKDYTGQTISDRGYQSTAIRKDGAAAYAYKMGVNYALRKGGPVFLARIVMPVGSCAGQGGNSETNSKQVSGEFILPRNTTFKVLKQQNPEPEVFAKQPQVDLDKIRKAGGIKLIDVVAATPCDKQEPVKPKRP